MKGKYERQFIKQCDKYIDFVYPAHENSVQEGFEYFFESKQQESKSKKSDILLMYELSKNNLKGAFKKIQTILKYRKDMFRGRNECFTDLNPYFEELATTGKIENNPKLIQSFPNNDLLNDLTNFINSQWNDVIFGFTELPTQLIFKNKMVLFKNVLIIGQEMKKDMIDQAPKPPAGDETMRVYASIGLVINEIARWLRERGVKCQSNHPLGGLVCTPPLAGKAGLGWQGRHGSLITPEFGPRLRLAPIFLQDKIFEFTDNQDHQWIEKYCESCGLCQKSCPTQAIFSEKTISIPNVEIIGAMRTCIDRDKCFPYFNATVGCSVCIKVCPFSQGNERYQKLKMVFERKEH